MIASIIMLLYFMGLITIENAYISLYVTAALFLIAEVGVVSFGLLFLNALLAGYAAFALHMGHTTIFGLNVGWPVLFGFAFVELLIIIIVIFIHVRLRRMKSTTGVENMIGQKATVIKWNGFKGTIMFEGEIWKARSEKEMDLKKDDLVTIDSVNKLDITVIA